MLYCVKFIFWWLYTLTSLFNFIYWGDQVVKMSMTNFRCWLFREQQGETFFSFTETSPSHVVPIAAWLIEVWKNGQKPLQCYPLLSICFQRSVDFKRLVHPLIQNICSSPSLILTTFPRLYINYSLLSAWFHFSSFLFTYLVRELCVTKAYSSQALQPSSCARYDILYTS